MRLFPICRRLRSRRFWKSGADEIHTCKARITCPFSQSIMLEINMVRLKHFAGLLLVPMLVFAASAAPAEEVGKVGVDWFGNDIVVDAVHDPKVKGITC
ncbi:CreA family protein, partial [Brucella abortus]